VSTVESVPASVDLYVTVSEEIQHTDAENDVKLAERRYRAATVERSPKDADSVDIFLDLSVEENGVSEVWLRHVEESAENETTPIVADVYNDAVEVLETTFERVDVNHDDAKIFNIGPNGDQVSTL
jgi:hypothetical protein